MISERQARPERVHNTASHPLGIVYVCVAVITTVLAVCCENPSPLEEDANPYHVRVYEFLPAPGQFINSGYSTATMKDACDYAQSVLNAGNTLSLGAFGGYVVIGFDKPVARLHSSCEIGIRSNQTVSSSEPGIVYVSRDDNGNEVPDDTWYELRASLYDDPGTIHDYKVTYFRPNTDGSIPFIDSDNRDGALPHLVYHQQEYYPAWVSESSYTLSGTRLQARNYDQSGNGTMWINPSYGSGYADNYDDDPSHMDQGYILFNLSDAVDSSGNPVPLDRADFVKVQTGVLAVSGWLGEASTEVCGFWNRSI